MQRRSKKENTQTQNRNQVFLVVDEKKNIRTYSIEAR